MKSKQNKYSQLYAKIDRKQLSEQALATLDKLRLATGNFRTKNQESLDLFQEFYDKLSEKKPTAIKGSPENKAMIKEMLKERGRKLAEGRKAKQKEKSEGKSEGNDIDANRPAKPFGWRMRGKHNYKKPTRADITEGRAYYEGRVNRADVKRKKYPMLKKGGMAEGNEIKEGDLVMHKKYGWIMRVDKIEDGKYYLENDKRGMEISGKAGNNGSYGKSDIEKYENGGYMAKGGAIENQYESRTAEDIWDSYNKEQRLHFLYDHAEEINEYKGLEEERENPWFNNAYKSDWNNLDKDIKNRFENHVRGGQYAKGGEIDAKYSVWVRKGANDDEEVVKRNLTKRQAVKLMDKLFDEDKYYEVGLSNMFSYGGEMDDEEGVDLFEDYEDQPQEVQDILEKYDFEDADYQTLKKLKKELNSIGYTFDYDMDGSAYDLRKIGQRGKSEFYAKGGTIGGMSTYVSSRDIQEIKLTINGDMKTLKGSDLMDGVYVKKASLKAKFDAYEVYNKLADMAYDIWDKLNIQSGSQIENSDSLQKKLQEEYEKVGIDSLFKSLTKLQRAKVAKILTNENQHSLRNYLALRGYEGDKEYQSYKDGYDNQPKGRKYYLSPYVITRVVTMEHGGEVFYTEKHKND